MGAIPAGQTLTLRVTMPRDMGVTGVTLLLGRDGAPDRELPLSWESTDGDTEWWRADVTFDAPDIWFYRFAYTTAWGMGNICFHSSGMGCFSDSGERWQQTVYDPDYRTPDWMPGGIMYQIFPDRFFASGTPKKDVPTDRRMHAGPDEAPDWQPDPVSGRWNTDYYGGDLEGIREKLDYLASLGVTCLYLNPIFEAHSNHRYDTADYMRIDPLLGTQADFTALCRDAKVRGIRVIFDGVFSHTGDDSRYFNRFGRYADVGAAQSPDSPYHSWYRFRPGGGYDAWWGVKSLPETREEDPGYRAFITGEDGVIRHWMACGASGVRLDVADELPDDFIELVRAAVRGADPEGLVLGEVWEDASNKVSYGARRRYLLGHELDSVMNYPFREAIVDFLTGGSAEVFIDRVLTVCENYPKPALDCLMNILGTHDTERITSVLGGLTGEGIDRRQQAALRLTPEQRQTAERRLRCAYTLLYTLPGVPCIYYGDEILTEGLKDPFNRTCFDWSREGGGVTEHLRTLARLRRAHACLAAGELTCVSAMLGCAAYRRTAPGDALVVVANMNPHDITYYLPHRERGYAPVLGELRGNAVTVPAESAVIVTEL